MQEQQQVLQQQWQEQQEQLQQQQQQQQQQVYHQQRRRKSSNDLGIPGQEAAQGRERGDNSGALLASGLPVRVGAAGEGRSRGASIDSSTASGARGNGSPDIWSRRKSKSEAKVGWEGAEEGQGQGGAPVSSQLPSLPPLGVAGARGGSKGVAGKEALGMGPGRCNR